jgi:hypothetical protein
MSIISNIKHGRVNKRRLHKLKKYSGYRAARKSMKIGSSKKRKSGGKKTTMPVTKPSSGSKSKPRNRLARIRARRRKKYGNNRRKIKQARIRKRGF